MGGLQGNAAGLQHGVVPSCGTPDDRKLTLQGVIGPRDVGGVGVLVVFASASGHASKTKAMSWILRILLPLVLIFR